MSAHQQLFWLTVLGAVRAASEPPARIMVI